MIKKLTLIAILLLGLSSQQSHTYLDISPFQAICIVLYDAFFTPAPKKPVCVSKAIGECKKTYTLSPAFQKNKGKIVTAHRTTMLNVFDKGPEADLKKAIKYGNPEMVSKAIKHGADINCLYHECYDFQTGKALGNSSPLTTAMNELWSTNTEEKTHNLYTIIELLLDAGAQFPIEMIKSLTIAIEHPLHRFLTSNPPIDLVKKLVQIIPEQLLHNSTLIPENIDEKPHATTKLCIYYPEQHKISWPIINILLDHGATIAYSSLWHESFINYYGNDIQGMYETGKRLNINFNKIATGIMMKLEHFYTTTYQHVSGQERAQYAILDVLLTKGYDIDFSDSNAQHFTYLVQTGINDYYNTTNSTNRSIDEKKAALRALKTIFNLLYQQDSLTIAAILNTLNIPSKQYSIILPTSYYTVNWSDIVEKAVIYRLTNTLNLIHEIGIQYRFPAPTIIETASLSALIHNDLKYLHQLTTMFTFDTTSLLQQAKAMGKWDIVGMLINQKHNNQKTE